MVGEKPAYRKPEVSRALCISAGLAGPKLRPKGVGDGEPVDIPAPPRLRDRGNAVRPLR